MKHPIQMSLCLLLCVALLLAALPVSAAAPEETGAPVSGEPPAGDAPEPTEEPAPTEEPEPTDAPEPTEEPEPTKEPEPTEEPTPTEEPAPTDEPTPTEEPTPTDEPAPTEEPEETVIFPDVKAKAWFAPYIEKVTQLPGVIDGRMDADGVKRFHPEADVKRGEFLKLAICAAGITVILYTLDASRNGIHWAGEYYTIALEENLLVTNRQGSEHHGDSEPDQAQVMEIFPCTFEALEQPISRYEMAVILSNLCANTLMEKAVIVSEPWAHIPDYQAIAAGGVASVEQAYGKGLLVGYEDGSFRGGNTLSRAQAAVVIERLLWDNDRSSPSWAEPQPETAEQVQESAEYEGYPSFAFWLRGHMNAWGTLDSVARQRIFGNANKSYFYSAADAAPYMVNVTIPIWIIDKYGVKQSSTATLTVHRLVAQEIRLIFQQIYDDPEQFPIYAGWNIGGARFTDHMRHAWGMAIDINSLYNAEMNFRSGYLRVTCGYGWQPYGVTTWLGRSIGSYRGSMSGASPYSIRPGGSVVKAFADYGWGWGGNGWSNGKSFDFMHFSVLPSGG